MDKNHKPYKHFILEDIRKTMCLALVFGMQENSIKEFSARKICDFPVFRNEQPKLCGFNHISGIMKVYHNMGFEEFDSDSFKSHLIKNNLSIQTGKIEFARIHERKFLSNKGNALDGIIRNGGFAFGLNIGGNPIGTGYKTYIPFLEEMGCMKICGLYVLSNIINSPIVYLVCGDILRGYITPKDFASFKGN